MGKSADSTSTNKTKYQTKTFNTNSQGISSPVITGDSGNVHVAVVDQGTVQQATAISKAAVAGNVATSQSAMKAITDTVASTAQTNDQALQMAQALGNDQLKNNEAALQMAQTATQNALSFANNASNNAQPQTSQSKYMTVALVAVAALAVLKK